MDHRLKAALLILPAFLLGLGVELHGDSPTGWSLIIQQGGSTKGAAVILNCSTNVTCSLSGGVVTVTASGGGGGGITALTQDVSASGSGSVAATVQGIDTVPLCTGFSPTNAQFLQYTTGSSPDPCWTAATASSGGGTASYGTYSSLPGTSSSGQIYVQTDGPYSFIANGSSGWQPFIQATNGGTITLPVPSGYSWGNQPSGDTVTTTHGGEIITAVGTSGDNWATRRVEAVPSTPWSIQMAFQLTPWNMEYTNAGIVAFNSTSGAGVVCGIGSNVIPSTVPARVLLYQEWNSYTSINGSSPFLDAYLPGTLAWIKMYNDGTNIHCYESTTGGVTWNLYFTQALSTFYNGASVNSVGYGYDLNNSTISGTLWLLHWLQGTS
jgi:hypothetical protein